MFRKKLTTLFLILSLTGLAIAGEDNSRQRADIKSLVTELNYLIEVTQQLQKTYGGDTSKIRFNYNALLAQLVTTRDGIKSYLNDDVMELHLAPPAVVKQDVVVVR